MSRKRRNGMTYRFKLQSAAIDSGDCLDGVWCVIHHHTYPTRIDLVRVKFHFDRNYWRRIDLLCRSGHHHHDV